MRGRVFTFEETTPWIWFYSSMESGGKLNFPFVLVGTLWSNSLSDPVYSLVSGGNYPYVGGYHKRFFYNVPRRR